jgi:hypothetical protein
MVAGSENEQRHQNNRGSHAKPPCMKNGRLMTSLPEGRAA